VFVVFVERIKMLPVPFAGQCTSNETSRLPKGASEAFFTWAERVTVSFCQKLSLGWSFPCPPRGV